jgi:hypothetical protein
VQALVALVLTAGPVTTQRQADALADALASFTQKSRERFASAAGVSKPGPITWDQVVDAVRSSFVMQRAS